MPFLSLVPSGVKMALLAALVTAAGLFYWHYTIVKGERDAALAQVGALQVAKAAQDETIKSLEKTVDEWRTSAQRFQETLGVMAEAQKESAKEQRRLNDILGKHDLDLLSLGKPGLIERRINKGSNDIMKQFETVTGADK